MRRIILLSCLLSLPLFSWAYTRTFTDLRETRYCEILVSSGWMRFDVYSTINLNTCPAKAWNQLNKSDVKAETDSWMVIMNGPRYWTMDEIHSTPLVKNTSKTFKTLKMHKIAKAKVTLSLLMSQKPYTAKHIERDTMFVYNKGKPVYELIDPDGNVYVMQSYSHEKEPITPEDLPKLKQKLKLPKGWTFKTGTVKQTQKLRTHDNQARVLQDDFMNSYQHAPHDFLE